MVVLLQSAYAGGENTLMSQFVPPDPLKAYGYLRLERYAAEGDFAHRLDQEIAGAVAALTPDQQRRMDMWADDMYRRFLAASLPQHFSDSIHSCY
jgi:hypothetical protein